MSEELANRLEKIKQEARASFGEGHAEKWLNSPSRFFQGQSPMQFATEPDKAQSVLEHVGYFKGVRI